MAFQHGRLRLIIRSVLRSKISENLIVAKNFDLEERLSDQREQNYLSYIKLHKSGRYDIMNHWRRCHWDYTSEGLNTVSKFKIPETFCEFNKDNRISSFDPEQIIVRMDRLDGLISLTRDDWSENQLMDNLERFLDNPDDQDSRCITEKFIQDVNDFKDFRPVFAGLWDDVRELFQPGENEWANKLRDRWGMGHFDPKEGPPIPVLLWRYRVADILAVYPDVQNCLAVPTVLESGLNSCFCPTPRATTSGMRLTSLKVVVT